MVPDAPPSDLRAIEDDIIGLGPDLERGIGELCHIIFPRSGERVMDSHISLQFLVVFQQGKIDHPEELIFPFLDQPFLPGQMKAQLTQHLVHHLGPVGDKKEEISRFPLHPGHYLPQGIGAEEFGNGRLGPFGFNLDPGQSPCTIGLGHTDQLLYLLA